MPPCMGSVKPSLGYIYIRQREVIENENDDKVNVADDDENMKPKT